MVKICAIADTHEQHRELVIPECDILIHAGDITYHGDLDKLEDFNAWGSELIDEGIVGDFVVIAGNHDFSLQRQARLAEGCLQDLTYLRDSEVTIKGLRIYGSPWQLWFHDWAFNVVEKDIGEYWDKIPNGIDILITHGPLYMIGDMTTTAEHVGDAKLRAAVERIKPKLFVCGHIHEGYGTYKLGDTVVVNASSCTRKYKPTNKPIVIEL